MERKLDDEPAYLSDQPYRFALTDRSAMCFSASDQLDAKCVRGLRDYLNREKNLGGYHPYSITALSNFAFALDQTNRREQVKRLRRDVVIRREKMLGADHDDTYTAKKHLVSVLDDQPQEQFDVLSEMLSSRLSTKGKNHNHTLFAIQDLGKALNRLVNQNNNKIRCRSAGDKRPTTEKEKESMYKGLSMLDAHLKLVRDVLGDSHIRTFAIMTMLASEICQYGLVEEAEMILRYVLNRRPQTVKDDTTGLARHMALLALVLCRRRKYTEAKQIISNVIDVRSDSLGIDHDETKRARQDLANVIKDETSFEGPKEPPPADAASTPLDRVAYLGMVETAKLLLELGVSPQRQLHALTGPTLFKAIQGGHMEMMKLLLTHKADVSAKDPKSGQSPIECAVIRNRHDFWPLLLDHGADPRDVNIPRGGTMLHFAASQGNDEGIRALLRKNIDASTMDDYGYSAFHAAILNGKLQSLEILLERSDKLPPTDDGGRTLLHLAARKGNRDIVKLLVDILYSKVDLRDANGITPLAEAAFRGHGEVVKELVEVYGADCSIASPEGRTPLHCAILGGDQTVVNFLISRGESLQQRDKAGHDGLSYAVFGGRVHMMRQIMECCSNLEESDTGPWSHLHWACRSGDLQTLKILLDKGCKARTIVDAESGSSWCPLSVAALHQNEYIFPLDEHRSIDQTCEEVRAEVLRRLYVRDVEYQKGVKSQAYCDMCLSVSIIREVG